MIASEIRRVEGQDTEPTHLTGLGAEQAAS